MKSISYLSISLAAVLSLKGVSTQASMSDRYPSQSNFCTALFTTSSQGISEKQNADKNRWPIKTLKAAQDFVSDRILTEALQLPEQRTFKEKLFRLRPFSIVAAKMKEIDLSTISAFDTRHQPLSNSSDFLKDSFTVFSHFKESEIILEGNYSSIPLSTTEYRGTESILQFLQQTQDLSREWKNKTDKDLQDIADRFSKHDRIRFLLSGLVTTLGSYLSYGVATDILDGKYISAAIISAFLVSDRQTYKNMFLDLKNYSYAIINSDAMTKIYNENGLKSSLKAHQFMEEVALILKQESPWNPLADFMHLSDGVNVPRELAQAIAYGSSEEFLQKNIVDHAHEEHKTTKTPDHYWQLGYHLSFAYLPKDPAFPEKDIEPTLLITTYLEKNDKKPPAPKKPKDKKKTAIEESLENNEALAPVRY